MVSEHTADCSTATQQICKPVVCKTEHHCYGPTVVVFCVMTKIAMGAYLSLFLYSFSSVDGYNGGNANYSRRSFIGKSIAVSTFGIAGASSFVSVDVDSERSFSNPACDTLEKRKFLRFHPASSHAYYAEVGSDGERSPETAAFNLQVKNNSCFILFVIYLCQISCFSNICPSFPPSLLDFSGNQGKTNHGKVRVARFQDRH